MRPLRVRTGMARIVAMLVLADVRIDDLDVLRAVRASSNCVASDAAERRAHRACAPNAMSTSSARARSRSKIDVDLRRELHRPNS